MGWRIASALILMIVGFTAATQFIAHVFAYQAALGTPILTIGETRIYAPWSVAAWDARWAERYTRPFAISRLITFGSVAVAALVAASALVKSHVLKPFGAAAWGGFDDCEAAGLFAAQGTVLGKFAGEILCFDGPEHQLLVGASRSGKGRGHVVPTLLTWPRSALVLDVKGELADGDPRVGFPGTAGFRETIGPVLRFAPTRGDSISFNPLFEVRLGADEVRDVQNIVEIIVDPAGDGRHQDFWDRSAKQVIVGLILHVLYAEPLARKNLATVREKLRDLQNTANEMRTTLHRRNPATNMPEVHPEVLHAAESFLAGEERLQSGVKATAESFFGLFADPIVAAKTATSDFRVGDLMCGATPVTLFLQPPPSDAQRLMPLMRLILNQIARALMEKQTQDAQGREKKHSLLLVLDEFPQLGRMPFFETAMGAMAGYGLKSYLVCQSLNHITRAYGRDNVILDNCHIVTAFAAADMDTAKALAAMAGEVWEMRPQESVDRPRALLFARGSTTMREERRPLMLPGDVRALPRDEQLTFISGSKPIRSRKLRFDREAIFQSRLRPSAGTKLPLTTAHDWVQVAPLGRLVTDKKGATRVQPPPPAGQADLFGHLSNSERASAGLHQPPPDAPRQQATGI
ncbi:MAG: type IV secretory system conjugative DNA transfer family protein [Hyphomonadaceae bacterium]|nr:type IV secretory system conjugative DNA transfer family protein [Hyphomonadaceae bacterium]